MKYEKPSGSWVTWTLAAKVLLAERTLPLGIGNSSILAVSLEAVVSCQEKYGQSANIKDKRPTNEIREKKNLSRDRLRLGSFGGFR